MLRNGSAPPPAVRYPTGSRTGYALGATTPPRPRHTVQRWQRDRGARCGSTALGIAIFQVVGSYGAADNQPERKAIDAFALACILLGPLALARRDRGPLVAVAVAMGASAVYIGAGYPYGPIFVSVVVALYTAVQLAPRRATWLLAAAGYAAYLVAGTVDDRADGAGVLHFALVAGWLVVVLAVSEVIRVRREQLAEHARTAEEEERRRRSDQRLLLAQELHDVLAHNISLINVQAGVALHLLDEQPDQARPALANIKEASGEALRELRTALDVLRRGEEAPRSPAPRLADLDALLAGVRASGLDVRLEEDGAAPASACGRRAGRPPDHPGGPHQRRPPCTSHHGDRPPRLRRGRAPRGGR